MKIKCPEYGAMYPQQDCGHQGLKLAALRAENERLTELNWHGAAVIEELKAISEHKSARIAEFVAALIAIDLLSSQGFAPALTEIGKIAGAALKGDAE